MGTLSPKALSQLWTEMLNHARKNGFGFAEISPALKAKIDADYDAEFPQTSAMIRQGTKVVAAIHKRHGILP